MTTITAPFGFITHEDLFQQRVAVPGIPRVTTMVLDSARLWSDITDSLLANWTEQTEVAAEEYELPSFGTLQPLDPETGKPLPTNDIGATFKVAYPIQAGGDAWGGNRVTSKLMTVGEISKQVYRIQQNDRDWLVRHMLAAVYANVQWTYRDKTGIGGTKGLGDITIVPLANGDAVTYPHVGALAGATDNHYIAQAAAIADGTNPYITIDAKLKSHPSNAGRRILCYIPTALKASTMALDTFVPPMQSDIRPGTDTAYAVNAPDALPGEEVLGTIAGTSCWVIEMVSLPEANKIIAVMEGLPFLKMRTYPIPEYKGLFNEDDMTDPTCPTHRLLRFCGFGVANRVAALVYQVGNASYSISAAVTAPLPK